MPRRCLVALLVTGCVLGVQHLAPAAATVTPTTRSVPTTTTHRAGSVLAWDTWNLGPWSATSPARPAGTTLTRAGARRATTTPGRVVHATTVPLTRQERELAWLASPGTQCVLKAESRWHYRIGGMEPYGGAWQFSVVTWQAIGFSGLPNQASPATQNNAAYKLWTLVGYSQWETAAGCGLG